MDVSTWQIVYPLDTQYLRLRVRLCAFLSIWILRKFEMHVLMIVKCEMWIIN